MEIIATHLGADFDAFASALLARKLHPEARIFFPGSKEESVRRMLDGPLGEALDVPEVRAKEIDPRKIDRLILCDVVQRSRIGVVADWLAEHPGIEVIAYDHHDPTEDDVPGAAAAGGVIDPGAGSTATLLAEIFRERGIEVSATEATLLLLGLYEDTGSLTYANTGPRELLAAAWLVERGGDLSAVRRYAVQRLDPGRLDILHRMTDALSLRRIRGHRVGVLALELGDFVDELAPLVNRCLEIFELPLLFAVFGEGDRVTLIARGDVPGVHLGRLMEDFAGGGGHPTAASARLKGVTPLEVRELLLAFLEGALPPAVRAADLMVTGFYTLAAGTTVAAAKAALVERRINAAPVVRPEGENGRRAVGVVGVVTRQTLDGALQHGFGDRAVETVADRDLEWVAPETSVEDVGESFLRRHPRLILVGEGEGESRELVGLITRMQLLRHLHSRLREAGTGVERRMAHLPEERAPVGGLLRERLPPALAAQVEAIVAVSRLHDIPVYLVGGIVRDLLLGRENRDLDLVVEGDGPHFARLLAEALGGRVRVHEAFMTAVVVDPEERHVDVASARSEFYRAPAALPEVQMSPLRQDLYRRDFTINSLAIRLGPDRSQELVDYFGGRRDLENGLLRVLHSLSFIDDPTRVLRAVRLSLRLGFEISPETLHLVEVALAEGVFDRLSGSRLREELILLLDDPALAVSGLERLEALEVLGVIHPDLRLDEADRERLRQAVAAWDWYTVAGLDEPPAALWRLMLVALCQQEPAHSTGKGGAFGPRQVEEIADRLMLAGDDRDLLVGSRRRLAAAREVLTGPDPKPHQVSEAMARLSGEEALVLVGSPDETVRSWARRELVELRPLRLEVRGRDLLARGVPPGPPVGEALEAVRRARLDGEIGAEEELATALAYLEREAVTAEGS